MNKRSIVRIGALVAALGIVAFLVVFRRARARPPANNPMLQQQAPPQLNLHTPVYEAMMHAPEGSTPCESAFNAVQAAQEASRLEGSGPVFEYVAPHDEFIARCEALSKDAQVCMVPRYQAKHHEACARARPPADVLNAMRREPESPPPAGSVAPGSH